MDLQGTEGSRDDAEVCFKLFHKLFDLFSKASELRLTIHLYMGRPFCRTQAPCQGILHLPGDRS